MRYIMFLLLACLMMACEQEQSANLPEIHVGKGEMLKEITINKDVTRDIILSGGDGKFAVSIADSKIATADIIEDTLRIKGVVEGKTYVIIRSHNHQQRIDISVVPAKLTVSHDTLVLYPRDVEKYVTATGGGDVVDMKVDDPDEVMEAKWDYKTSVVEIRAKYEGSASVTFRTADSTEKRLQIYIKTENEIVDPGVYSTRSRTAYHIIKNVMVVKKANHGVWFHSNARPYGRQTNISLFAKDPLLKIAPIVNPEVGKRLRVKVLAVSDVSAFKYNEEYEVEVERIQGRLAVLRGRGFKFVTPFDRASK